MRYAEARIKAKEEKRINDERFRIYLTDAMKAAVENTANMYGGQTMTSRYANILFPVKPETRTAVEIIAALKSKMETSAPENGGA